MPQFSLLSGHDSDVVFVQLFISVMQGLGVRVAAFCPNIAGTGSSNPAGKLQSCSA